MSLKTKIKNNKFFQNMFGFESGIDIADDSKVLYRKNVVIKNIIFVSNLFFTILFTVLSFGENSNILLAFILFLVTFAYNIGLSRTIKKDPNDLVKQTIASYIECFYMFLLSIVIYLKLRFGSVDYLKEVGYILIYYSLAICSYYQDKKLLKFIFPWVLILTTFLHLAVTYNVLFTNNQNLEFIISFIKSDMFKDLILRTILLCIYMLVLYSIVSMTNFMQEERKKELTKRRQIQDEYTNAVSTIFNATLDISPRTEDNKRNIIAVSKMARRLAELLNLNEAKCQEIEDYAKVHIVNQINFDINGLTEDEVFLKLKEQTNLGSIIISRLQLERKCEILVQLQTNNNQIPEQIQINKHLVENNLVSQIVLICEIYVMMRNEQSYKRKYSVSNTIKAYEDGFNLVFDNNIYDLFMRYQKEMEQIYAEVYVEN